jgi:hypothetical protein
MNFFFLWRGKTDELFFPCDILSCIPLKIIHIESIKNIKKLVWRFQKITKGVKC